MWSPSASHHWSPSATPDDGLFPRTHSDGSHGGSFQRTCTPMTANGDISRSGTRDLGQRNATSLGRDRTGALHSVIAAKRIHRPPGGRFGGTTACLKEELIGKPDLGSRLRLECVCVLESSTWRFCCAATVLSQLAIVVYTTDLRAAGEPEPEWDFFVQIAYLVFYIIDLLVSAYTLRSEFLRDAACIADSIVVLADVFLISTVNMAGFALLRVARLARVVRVLRSFYIFREVYLMVQGLVSALRSLFFGCLLLFVLVSMWSIVSVEMLNEKVQALAEQGVFGDCDLCSQAYGSVMRANLTTLKTIIAGDEWGVVGEPLLVHHPEAAALLLLTIVTIQFGMLNIITAVIVDRIHEARVGDDLLTRTVKEENMRSSYEELLYAFGQMDSDENGLLTMNEIKTAFQTNRIFKDIVTQMGINASDMYMLFDMMDVDCSGDLTASEFVEQLHQVRGANPMTTIVVTRHMVQQLLENHAHNVNDQLRKMSTDIRSLKAGHKKERMATIKRRNVRSTVPEGHRCEFQLDEEDDEDLIQPDKVGRRLTVPSSFGVSQHGSKECTQDAVDRMMLATRTEGMLRREVVPDPAWHYRDQGDEELHHNEDLPPEAHLPEAPPSSMRVHNADVPPDSDLPEAPPSAMIVTPLGSRLFNDAKPDRQHIQWLPNDFETRSSLGEDLVADEHPLEPDAVRDDDEVGALQHSIQNCHVVAPRHSLQSDHSCADAKVLMTTQVRAAARAALFKAE